MKKFCITTITMLGFILHANTQSDPITAKADDYILSGQGAFEDVSIAKEDYYISSSHVSSISGVRHVYYQQSLKGIDIVNAVGSVHLNRDQAIAHSTSGFLNASEYSVQSGKVLSNSEAIERVGAYFALKYSGEIKLLEDKGGHSETKVYSNAGISRREISTALKYLRKDRDLILTWEVFIDKSDDGRMYLVYINAQTGVVERTISLTSECKFGCSTDGSLKNTGSVHVHQKDYENSEQFSVPNSYLVYAIPLEAPNEGPQSVVTAPWNASSPFGWHDTNGLAGAEFSITRGNNVWASEDQNADNIAGFSPDGGANLDFNFPVDTSMDPNTYLSGAITNLFYMNNIMHDVSYNYGFDEQAGNFQVNNYGNGGIGNDEVQADAQDGSGTNNANFGTPADGSKPRMQMYRWVNTMAFLDVNSPGDIAGSYSVSGASFGPTGVSVTGDVVLAEPNLGCSGFTNAGSVSGKIAMIDRGDCLFTIKVSNAAAAGAIGVIICNHTPGDGTFTMSGDDMQSIPAVMLSFEDCQILKQKLGSGLNVTLEISPARVQDSDLDNGIIAHEYGHGISNRLTGGAANVDCLDNQEQMGEGWSDFFALMLQLKPGDDGSIGNGIGTYSIDEHPNGDGIRPFPYSTDLSINPFTYNDITGVSIPHGLGSVWCTMLWDMTWNLIEKHGYEPDVYATTGGNGIAMQLVMEGMKLQPCSPGFVDGREAILMADTLLFGGVNGCEIWRAFARRGLGVGASQGSSDIVGDEVESYLIPESCPAEFLFPCSEESISYSGVSIPDGTDERANSTIAIDNSLIQPGDMVTLRAGQQINIQENFEVSSTSLLFLEIKPCDDSGLPMMAPQIKKRLIEERTARSVSRQDLAH